MRYRISGPARRDLQEIWRYTDTTWGTEQADAYIDASMSRVARTCAPVLQISAAPPLRAHESVETEANRAMSL